MAGAGKALRGGVVVIHGQRVFADRYGERFGEDGNGECREEVVKVESVRECGGEEVGVAKGGEGFYLGRGY